MENRNALAAVCCDLSGPTSVQLRFVPVVPAAQGEVRIAVKSAALNFPDLLMTYGKYQFKPDLPFTVGMEGAGIIEEVGDAAACRFSLGDNVIFKGKTGACCSSITVAEEAVEMLPAGLSFEEGAAFAVTFMTAYICLAKRGQLKPGEILLVHGAGGGVGQAAVSVGKALGATVIATASTTEKLDIARQSGADYLVNYHDVSFSEAVMDLTGGRGANVILDPVGGDVLERSVDCLSWAGRLLCVGFASGDFGRISLSELQQKGAVIIGIRAGEYSRRHPEEGRAAYQELSALVSSHSLRPWIGTQWPLSRISEALKAMENRSIVGKQVIKISGDQTS